MASDSLNQIGKYLRRANTNAGLALKRNFRALPKRDRARDTVSNVYPFKMTILVEEHGRPVTMDINFNKPPPEDCAADCFATTCEEYQLVGGGHSIALANPYEPGTVRVYMNGDTLEQAQWYEENPAAGLVYVQVTPSSMTVICYTYIIC